MIQRPKYNEIGLTEADNKVLISELTKYAEEGATDAELKSFRDTFISEKKKSTPKDGTKPVSTSTTKTESVASEPKDGSLDFLKQKPQTPTDIVLEGNRQIAQIPTKPEDRKKAIEEEKRSFLGETFAKLRAGSAQLGADLASAPELLYDVFSAPQNYIAKKFNIPSLATDAEKFKDVVGVDNVVKEYYKQDVANIRKESELVDKKYQQGIYDSFASGNYEDGFRQLTNSFSESLPATTSIMVGGAYAKAPQLLTATTMVFGGGKNEQLKDENPEMDANMRVANALGTGLAQGAFETVGSGSIGSAAKALVQREGAKKGATILKDGLVNFYKESLKKNPMLASVSGEAIEEWATTVTENSIDVATGKKPADFNVFEGSVDSFISGAFGGTVFGGGLKGIDKIVGEQDKKTVKQNFKKAFELQKQLENPNVSEPVKQEIQKAISQISKESQTIISNNVKSANKLPETVKNKLVESVGKMEEITKKVQEVKLDQNTSDASKQILLDGLKKEYEDALKLKSEIIDGKVSEVDVLPIKEQDKIKKEALKELTAELNPDGSKNIEITNEQITERANKLYKKQQETEIKDAETQSATPKSEVKSETEVQKPTETEKVNENEVLENGKYEYNGVIYNYDGTSLTNEAGDLYPLSFEEDSLLNQIRKNGKLIEPQAEVQEKEQAKKVKAEFVEDKEIEYTDGRGDKKTLNAKDIEFEFDESKGKFVFTENGNRISHVEIGKQNNNEVSVKLSGIFNPSMNKKGIGTIMYKNIAKFLKENYNLNLVSDTDRSVDSNALWEKLEREGLVIKEGDIYKYNYESTPTTNTPTDGNIRPTVSEDTDLANQQKPKTEVAETEVVESAVEPKPTEGVAEVEIFHGGSIKSTEDINDEVYFSTDKSQAKEYSKGNDGKVVSFKIKESDIADEEIAFETIKELGLKPKEEGWEVDELNLYELIDPRFETSLSDADRKILFDKLKEKGYKAFEFLDMNLETLKNDINNIVVLDKSILSKSEKSKPTRKETENKPLEEDSEGIKDITVKANIKNKSGKTVEINSVRTVDGKIVGVSGRLEGSGILGKQTFIAMDFDKSELDKIYIEGVNEGVKPNNEGVNQQKSRKETRIKATEAKIDEIANSLKDLESVFGIKIKAKSDDVNTQGTSRDQLIDFVAKTAKEIAKTGIEIDEAIRTVIEQIRKSYDIDVEVEEIKTYSQKQDEAPREVFVPEKGKHSVLQRLSKGDNAKREIDAINAVDFNYDVRNQEKVSREVDRFVKDVGVAEAYNAVKEGKIDKFDTQALIYNAVLQNMPIEHDKLYAELTNEDDKLRAEEAYVNEFGQVSKEFAKLQTNLGQGISVMNYIYNKNENLRYDLGKQKQDYKNRNNGILPKDVEEKFNKASKRLEEVNEQIKKREQELSELENISLVEEIEGAIKREKRISKRQKAPLTEYEQKRKKELSRKFFGTLNDVTRFAVIIADPEFREYLGLSFKEVKGDLANFTKKVLAEIGKGANEFLPEMFKVAQEVNEQSQKDSIKISIDGKVRVPKSVIESLIEKGFKDINAISEEVFRLLQDKYPDLTLRQVKESIVGYGREVAKTKSDIEIEIGRQKRIGQLELELEDLQNGIQKVKNEVKKRELSLKEQDLKSRIRQLENDLGITEQKRTQRTKEYTKRRIAELRQRISDGDFSKKQLRPVQQDPELRKLRAEKLELQETFAKEQYKLELRNRTKFRKVFDSLFDVLNIKRVGLTTGEFSPIFVQGGALTVRNIVRNPKRFLGDLKSMFKAMASPKYYKQTEQEIKSSEIFDVIRDAKLGIVETDTKQSAKEEMFQHQILESVFDYGAEKLGELVKSTMTQKYGKATAEKFANDVERITKEYVLILRPFERANNAYMNSLRYNRFLDGVKMLEASGKNPVDHLEDYKRVASAINTLTGRSNLGPLEQYKQGLGLIFFSAKLMASTWQKINPMHYWALRDSENWKKPSVAQKMLFVDALTHYAFMAGITLLIKAAYNASTDDEDEKATVEIDPRSSDFMKFKVGNVRLDYFGTGLAPFVLFSRMYTEETLNAQGEIKKMGEGNTKTRGGYLGQYFVNKLNPLTAGAFQYVNTGKKEYEGKTFREDSWGRDFSYGEYMTDIMPIIYGTGKEVLEEQPNLFGSLIMIQAAFGVNPSVYGNEERALKNMPDKDEEGNPIIKQGSAKAPSMPSMPKLPKMP
jgi:hypothetical protein